MRFQAFFITILLSSASLLKAHEQKTALTDILISERSGNLEIAHRFIIHDAEHSLHETTKLENIDLAQSQDAQAAFAKYVTERFALILHDETTLKLTLIGQERERGYLWVYQEAKIPPQLAMGFAIENKILQDVVTGQVNTVNVRFRTRVETLVFKSNTGRTYYRGPTIASDTEDESRSKP